MAYLGKTFKHSKDENFDAFLDSLKVPAAARAKGSSPTNSLTLNPDGTYTLDIQSPAFSSTHTFTSGVEFNEQTAAGVSKTTFTLEGDVLTQVQQFPHFSITTKREFSDSELKVTLTTSTWDGVAVRYYTAA
ncbi:fatty acid-binding protein 1 [Plutella xylostella]|uniref:fatty acid-binding protein 1 n=1 Tax=Plutella xylostella TaxID=51655 RepID=UPI0020323AA1|nr:fatty acid-binding protein 1 [Plutella xylostella]